MASLTMMASFAAVAAATPSRRGSFAVARTAKVERCQQEPARLQAAEEARPADGRRAVMLAAAVAAIGGAGVASAEPKKGTPEAKKKYASICAEMADQTHGAVDTLLGVLSTVIKEVRLLKGVHGDIQFIKDEMDSMSGFLLHLTKTEDRHDDQQRAWMKQVRDIAYIAEDCIGLYMSDLLPADGDGGLWALLRHIPALIWTIPARRRLATRIRELKVRVREVGERRMRYGVTVPDNKDRKQVAKPPVQQDIKGDEERMDAFQRALEEDVAGILPSHQLACEGATTTSRTDCRRTFNRAIDLLLHDRGYDEAQKETICAILQNCCSPDDVVFGGMPKMFLCALYVYRYATRQELEELKRSLLEEEAVGVPKEEAVMTFCYSLLSTQQKSCLQYLTAFLREDKISRTSLIRRWVAEGIVPKQGRTPEEAGERCFRDLVFRGKQQGRTPEEAGERCFRDLVFGGFIRPVRISDCGAVKSCKIEESAKDFVFNITNSENFVADELPAHHRRQLQIREMVQRTCQQKQDKQVPGPPLRNIRDLCCGSGTSSMPQDDTVPVAAADADLNDPMDELVHFLKKLPYTYRLNVLDLGGCRGLKKRHLKSICEVISLKYLSLRNTDVSRLPARRIQALRRLETLDIRDTDVPLGDTKHIFLRKLKHLLAGTTTTNGGDRSTKTRSRTTSDQVPLSAVRMPQRIGTMTSMETLSRVQVSSDGAELDQVAKLRTLRKLGMVLLHAGNEENTVRNRRLDQVITALAKSLRSLSIWVTDDGIVKISKQEGSAALILENLEVNGNVSLPFWKELEKLANVTLRDTQLDLRSLGDLQGLRCLRLRRNSCAHQQVLRFEASQFKALKFLVVEDGTITSVEFADGAAPQLEKIVWTFDKQDDKAPIIDGINNLGSLKLVEIRGDPGPQKVSELKRAIAAQTNHQVRVFEGE